MPTNFNLVKIVAVLRSKWIFLLSFTIAAAVVANIIFLFTTPQYESQTTVIPGNTELADKARFFNPGIKDLYSYFGSGDDLDRLMAIAEMDTTLKQIVQEFKLNDYYHNNEKNYTLAISKAVISLRKNLQFIKTPNDQLLIRYRNSNPITAANICNSIAHNIEKSLQFLWQENYSTTIVKLDSSILQLKKIYTTTSLNQAANEAEKILFAAEANNLLEQIKQYQKNSNEYKLALQTPPNAVLIMEKATPAQQVCWPNIPLGTAVAAILGLLFSSILVLTIHRSKE
ncbi:MAG: hypothetical protein EAZ13_07825 [Sphingobacteriia bacterium]|nr:MAG: hypothetical protein EAZ13_07825 [Sphingobacteriia bacterium]